MERTDYRTIAAEGWRGRVCRTWAEPLSEGDPLRILMRWPSELTRDREAARIWRIETPDGVLFAKHMWSELGGTVQRRGRALKRLAGSSAARRNLAISLGMAGCGFHVPRVVLAVRRRVGFGRVEDLLVTERAAGTVLDRVMADPGADRVGVLEMLGRRVAELHRCGFIHGDLLPGHVFVMDDRSDVVFIDHDESRRWWPGPPASRRRQNLKQLVHGARVKWGYALSRRLLAGYFEASGMGGRRARRMRYRALLEVRGRQRRRLQRRRAAEGSTVAPA